MIAEKRLGNIQEFPVGDRTVVGVWFEWFEVEKMRIVKTAEDGTQIGISIKESLSEGDVLTETEESIYVVHMKNARLIEIMVASMEEMGRLCFELGNRHLSLKIEENCVSIPFDAPTFAYLRKLGFDAVEKTGVFSGFIECKAHGSSGGGHSHA